MARTTGWFTKDGKRRPISAKGKEKAKQKPKATAGLSWSKQEKNVLGKDFLIYRGTGTVGRKQVSFAIYPSDMEKAILDSPDKKKCLKVIAFRKDSRSCIRLGDAKDIASAKAIAKRFLENLKKDPE